MPKIKFTQKALEKLPKTESGQIDYFDEALPGFGLRVGVGSKAFFAMKKVNGKDARKTIGKLSQYTLDEARVIARDYLHEMHKGVNITTKERERLKDIEVDKTKDVTLKEVISDMLDVRSAHLKKSTAEWYKQISDVYLADWVEMPMRTISRDMVRVRFLEISARSVRKAGGAKGSANAVFRFFKLVWNYGSSRFPGALPDNPVKVLSELRLWNKLARRTNHVDSADMKRWYEAVIAIENPTMRDYLLLLLFTGMRRSEAACMTWDDVDFANKSLRIKDTKNGKPLLIPLNTFLEDLLLNRSKFYREAGNNHVFPGAGITGHIVEPKRAIQAIGSKTGIKFTPHDLRRTLLGVATEISIDSFVKKALVNHTIAERRDDVTEGYVEITLSRLRKPSQYLCNQLMELCGISSDVSEEKRQGQNGNVVYLQEKRLTKQRA